jgi:PhoH-like ATPase
VAIFELREWEFPHFIGVDREGKRLKEVEEKLGRQLEPWDFLVTSDPVGGRELAYCLNPFRGFERIDNIPEVSKLRLRDGIIFTPLDIYQQIGIYALTQAPATLLTGSFGTGKTLLATAVALALTKRKIFITRPPIGISSDYDIGYLPGDKDEKMLNWAGGFLSALNFLYRGVRGFNYNTIKNQLFFEKFEIIPLNMIQGVSILSGEILIVDEVQLITPDYMSMILSRMGEGSKLFLLGDLKQTYSTLSQRESGLYRLQQVLPHSHLAWVELQKIYRNKLTEIAFKIIGADTGRREG